ncbi:MAG TPA: nucleoside triphosphate pyrophosphohydrolase [Thermotogota bacterium]|nr:nucleoside triphosphate pyrophosphohydrolase [Thermotogota bacterium]HPJ90048.1 nucleoside triphosphate pyrophosphohydrolase [Thermotogota bacterium]HPR95690.1 nucleoside triphosphate pyrophosphohydrolase [Thermotogota bacterium]
MHSLEQKKEEFAKLLGIMEKLRGENGCDWDKKQTHQSLKPYAIEEAYEVADAIDDGDLEELKGELGDLLLQSIFHSQIGMEEGTFDIYDVLLKVNEKMIRRHPHVFEDNQKYSYSYKQWEDIKAAEKGKKAESRIGKINKALPSLSMARRVQENAAECGFDWEETEDAVKKIDEELLELKEEIDIMQRSNSVETGRVEEEFGDLLFAAVNVARFLKIDPEIALRKATDKFIKRFRQMEDLIKKDDRIFEELDLKTLDDYWERIKKIGIQTEQ